MCTRWRTLTHSVGRINQPFRLKLEFTEGKKIPSHAAVDNIRLVSCLTGPSFVSLPFSFACSVFRILISIPTVSIEIAPGNGSCNDSARHTFRCNDGHCLPRDQVCDLSRDCPGGEDEDQDCGIKHLSLFTYSDIRLLGACRTTYRCRFSKRQRCRTTRLCRLLSDKAMSSDNRLDILEATTVCRSICYKHLSILLLFA